MTKPLKNFDNFKTFYLNSLYQSKPLNIIPINEDDYKIQIKEEVINCINCKVPVNIYGINGGGKSNFIKELLYENTKIVEKQGGYNFKDIAITDIYVIKPKKEKSELEIFRNKRNNIIRSLNTIDDILVIIKLHEMSNSYYLFKLLIEIGIARIQQLNPDEEDKFHKIWKALDQNLKNSNKYFNNNLEMLELTYETFWNLKGTRQILGNLTLIIDDINDADLLLKYSSKISRLLSMLRNYNNGFILVSSFNIKSLYNQKLQFVEGIHEIYYKYHFPLKILEEEVFKFLRIEEQLSASVSNIFDPIKKKMKKKNDIKIDGIASRDVSDSEEYNSCSSKTIDLLDLKEENDFKEEINIKFESNKKASACKQEKSIKKINNNNDHPFYINLNLTNDKNSVPNLLDKKIDKKKDKKKKQKKIISVTDDFIRRSIAFFKLYVYNYNEFLYFFKNYTEYALSKTKKEADQAISQYFRGTYIHFTSQNLDNSSKISPLENFDIYYHLLEKNSEDLRDNLSTCQKLFLYATFLSSKIDEKDDLNLFVDGRSHLAYLNKLKRKKTERSEMSIGSTCRLGVDMITGEISKKQNMLRIIDIYKSLLLKASIKNNFFPKSKIILRNFLVKYCSVLFYENVLFLNLD